MRAEAKRIEHTLLTKHLDRLIRARLVEPDEPQWIAADFNNQKQRHSRSAGIEQVALWALDQVGLMPLLETLDLTPSMRRAIVGSLVGRMAHPASERETFRWLRDNSALGEFLGTTYDTTSLQQLYRASDALLAHREVIESHIHDVSQQLFGLGPTVTLLDLTNTYLEGTGKGQQNAKYGRSKEKRSDCPLITLALVLDGNGFVQRSRVYPGNVQEASTLQAMLEDLQAPADAVVLMDRGIATEASVSWLKEHGYRYLVVSRRRDRRFDAEQAVTTYTRSKDEVQIQAVTEGDEQFLYCRSSARVRKEEALMKRHMDKLEAQLQKLSDGLQRPKTRKKINYVHERIGRLRQTYHQVSKHYTIEVVADKDKVKAVAVRWRVDPKAHTRLTHPGVYCLRTNVEHRKPDELWHTYTMLTDVEAAFRSLKSELGCRPVYHQKDKRTEGHLFIAVLAYQMVHLIRSRLRQKGIHHSWTTLRNILRPLARSTRVFQCRDGVLHSRVTDEPENASQVAIYRALGIPDCRLGVRNTIVVKPR